MKEHNSKKLVSGSITSKNYEAIPKNITVAYAIISDLNKRGLIDVYVSDSTDDKMAITYSIKEE